MKRQITTLLTGLLLLVSGISSNAQKRELKFETKPAIYAANEEWLTFACEVPEGTVDLGLKNQSEMYWYSLYNLGNLLFRSGMGVHVINNPLFEKHVMEDKGKPWYNPGNKIMGARKFLMFKVAQFKARSGTYKLDNMYGGFGPPKGAFPVYLEYASGKPVFDTEPQLDDFSTLRWDMKSFDKTLNPGAWGQSMLKAVLWTRDFFDHNRTSGGVTYIGIGAHDGADGFRGSMLTALSLIKSYALKSQLAYHVKTGELGGVDPKAYNPKEGPVYYPHEYKPKFKKTRMKGKVPPIVRKYKVTDPSSDLFDVASLLWAESEFYYVTDPKNKDSFDKLYGDTKWDPRKMSEAQLKKVFRSGKTVFPKGKPHMLAKGITAVNFKNLMGLHFNKKKGTLVDSWHPKRKQSHTISTPNAGIAMVALANTYHRLQDVPKIRKGAKKILMAQANFLIRHQEKNGGIPNRFNLKDGTSGSGEAKTLLSQTFAIRGLISAYQVTGNDRYLDAARDIYNYMEKSLWSDQAGVYRSARGARVSTYNGLNYGSTLGALRELAIREKGSDRQQIVDRLDTFFETVKQKNGLQLAELGQTGDPVPSARKQKKMKQKLHTLKKKDPARAKQLMTKMQDFDSDGVPKPKFVKGTQHGAAPVTISGVQIPTH